MEVKTQPLIETDMRPLVCPTCGDPECNGPEANHHHDTLYSTHRDAEIMDQAQQTSFMYFRFLVLLAGRVKSTPTWKATPIPLRNKAMQEVARLSGVEISWRTAKTLVDSIRN